MFITLTYIYFDRQLSLDRFGASPSLASKQKTFSGQLEVLLLKYCVCAQVKLVHTLSSQG